MIIRKSQAELEKMRRSGLLVSKILEQLAAMVEPGVTTADLESTAEKMMAALEQVAATGFLEPELEDIRNISDADAAAAMAGALAESCALRQSDEIRLA